MVSWLSLPLSDSAPVAGRITPILIGAPAAALAALEELGLLDAAGAVEVLALDAAGAAALAALDGLVLPDAAGLALEAAAGEDA